MRFHQRPFRASQAIILICALLGAAPMVANANPIEADSQGNRLYVLLAHRNLHSSLDGVSVTVAMPSFTSPGTSLHTPTSVPSDSARLAAFSFDVDPGVPLGTAGEALVSISGTVAGTPVGTIFSVPLSVASNAPAVVIVGTNLGHEDVDTDGDGVADWVETLFGSDPFDLLSLPGPSTLSVPALSLFALACLVGLFALAGHAFQRTARDRPGDVDRGMR